MLAFLPASRSLEKFESKTRVKSTSPLSMTLRISASSVTCTMRTKVGEPSTAPTTRSAPRPRSLSRTAKLTLRTSMVAAQPKMTICARGGTMMRMRETLLKKRTMSSFQAMAQRRCRENMALPYGIILCFF